MSEEEKSPELSHSRFKASNSFKTDSSMKSYRSNQQQEESIDQKDIQVQLLTQTNVFPKKMFTTKVKEKETS